jgi:hypothetical protein
MNLFVKPLHDKIGTFFERDAIEWYSTPPGKTNISYMSSEIIGMLKRSASVRMSVKCSLLKTFPQGFPTLLIRIARVFESILDSMSVRSICHSFEGSKRYINK